jgi:hypothetical protein
VSQVQEPNDQWVMSIANTYFRRANWADAVTWYQRAPLNIRHMFHLVRVILLGAAASASVDLLKRPNWHSRSAEGDILSGIMIAMLEITGKSIGSNPTKGTQAIDGLAALTEISPENRAACKFAQAWNACQSQTNPPGACALFDEAFAILAAPLEFPMTDSYALGILSFCAGIFGETACKAGNASAGGNGYPKVSSPGGGSPQNVLIGYKDVRFSNTSNNQAQTSIVFDFVNRKVKPTGYMIQVYSEPWQSWTMSGSMDQNDWETLDKREKITFMQTSPLSDLCHGFAVKEPERSYRYIRFHLTEATSAGHWYMCTAAMELYGTIY